MQKDIPEFLYHYTNLEALALILKNKTMRFSPLSKLDDLDEAKFKSCDIFAEYTYISSWTLDEQESIPFWSMYTRNMSGVRIKLRINPFNKYPVEGYARYLIDGNEKVDFCIPSSEIIQEKYVILPMCFSDEVKYTKKEDNLYPDIAKIQDNILDINLPLIGAFKKKEWHFQKEWRYRLFCIPIKKEDITKIGELAKVVAERRKPSINYIDVGISETYLKKIEIMMGPKMSEGEKEILQLLVDKYCPSAKIVESQLKIR